MEQTPRPPKPPSQWLLWVGVVAALVVAWIVNLKMNTVAFPINQPVAIAMFPSAEWQTKSHQSAAGRAETVSVCYVSNSEWILPSGPAVAIYGADGVLIDSTTDLGEHPAFAQKWKHILR